MVYLGNTSESRLTFKTDDELRCPQSVVSMTIKATRDITNIQRLDKAYRDQGFLAHPQGRRDSAASYAPINPLVDSRYWGCLFTRLVCPLTYYVSRFPANDANPFARAEEAVYNTATSGHGQVQPALGGQYPCDIHHADSLFIDVGDAAVIGTPLSLLLLPCTPSFRLHKS
jgi:hypothetical protein